MANQAETVLFSNLMSQMYALRQQGQLCDVQLLVNNTIIPAHRVVLAAFSPYFRAMFCSQLNESQQSSVSIQDFSTAIVSLIVEYAYTASIDITEENVQMILRAASFMQIETLENLCTQFLLVHLHPSNCLGIREFALCLGCSSLYSAADSFCQDHFFEMSEHDEFLHLTASQVINLVGRDALKVRKEEDVYTAVIRWLEHAPEERAEDMVKIMDKVRLPLVQWEFLIGKVSKHKLFTSNERCWQYVQQARAFQASSFHPDLNNFAFNEAVVLAQPRMGFGTTDFLYAVGGESANREILQSVEGFSPVTNQTKQFSPLPTRRRSFGVAIVDNMLFTVGGSDGSSAVRTVEVYDIEKDVWKACTSLREQRTSVSAVAVEGKVFAVGGHDGQKALSSVEVYDSDSNTWTLTTELQRARSMAASVCLKNQLYVLGGYDGSTDLHSAEKLEARRIGWVSIASMQEPRSMCDAAVLDEHIVVVGGSNGTQCLSSVEMYDPASNQWTSLHGLTVPRRGLGGAVIQGTLYAAGGHDGTHYLNSVEKYSSYTQGWTVVGHLEDSRGRFGFV